MFYVWVALVFLLGAGVGSFLNVCIARLPLEKSILWPLGSRCGRCLRPVRWHDNLPLVSYWVLRGRCRDCGQRFGVSYFLVELFTAAAFAGLFYLEVGRNVLDLPFLKDRAVQEDLAWGVVPGRAWAVFGWHATLLSFLIITSLCDVRYMEVPLPVTVFGTLVGLVGSAFLAWPFPDERAAPVPANQVAFTPPQQGLYPWPVWQPHQLPALLPPGSWQLGLATGLAGALAGMLTLRGVRFLFGLGRGKEGLGIGDADMMMMAGAFVGWQPILIAFFVGVFAALFVGVAQLLRKGDHPLAFSPALGVGVMATLLTWPAVGRHFFLLFSDAWVLGLLAGGGAVILLAAAFLLRLLRGAGQGPHKEKAEAAAGEPKKV